MVHEEVLIVFLSFNVITCIIHIYYYFLSDDYHKLQTTLRMRLEKPQELPKLNMKAVRQYEKIPDPPSELELFFKVCYTYMGPIRHSQGN